MSPKHAIRAELLGLARTGRFFPVTYSPDGTPHQISPDATPKAPASCECNEVSGSFEIDTSIGLRRAVKRSAWRFELMLAWNCEVTAEYFERDVTFEVPRIIDKDGPVVFLRLVSSEYAHPTRQAKSDGTIIRYVFEAEEGRR